MPAKEPLKDVGNQRYIKGATPKRSDDNLRPPPLNYGLSLAEMLKEDPPEGFVEPSLTLSAVKSPTTESPAAKSPSGGSPIATPKSSTLKKHHIINKPSFASVRRLFSPKQKNEAFQEGLQSTRRKYTPIVTRQDASFNTAGSPNPQLSVQDSPALNSPPRDYNVFTTPRQSSSPFSATNISPFKHEVTAQTSFGSHKKTGATTPTHSSHQPSSSFTTSPNSSPGKIYGQPPACMARPVIPRKVTHEHLRLTKFPPVSKEDIAKLPKEIEPTLPSPELSPFAQLSPIVSRYHSPSTSFHNVSGLSLNHPVGYRDTFKDDEEFFDFPATPVKHLQPGRRDYSTASIAKMPETPEQLSRYPLPKLNRKRKGREDRVANNAPPAAIAKETTGLGISTREYPHSSTDNEIAYPQGSLPPASYETPTPTSPVTPKSWYMTAPSSPERKGPVTKSEVVSPPMPRIRDDYVAAAKPPYEDPRHPPSPSRDPYVAEAEPATANILRYFADCTPKTIRQARLGITDERERLKVQAKVRGLTGTELVMRHPGEPAHPNHERGFHAKNLWCRRHTSPCSACNSACCVMAEALKAYDEASNPGAEAVVREACEVIGACAEAADISTFVECGECVEFVCPECVGVCPVEGCGILFCKVSTTIEDRGWNVR